MTHSSTAFAAAQVCAGVDKPHAKLLRAPSTAHKPNLNCTKQAQTSHHLCRCTQAPVHTNHAGACAHQPCRRLCTPTL
jgi:hypothetical protein